MLRCFRRVARTFAPPSQRRAAPRLGVTFRPLEQLEARETPALCTWTGTASTTFDNPLNWNGGVPRAGDEVVFLPRVVATTEEGLPVYGSSVDCYGMTGATEGDSTGIYKSVTLAGNYTGRVTLSSGFTTKALGLHNGIIDQGGSGRDITIVPGYTGPLTATFHWTGGTLNSTTYLANVTITGSGTTALVAPTNGGTVNLGSHINLSSGAIATAKEGTTNILNDGVEFNIDANCGILVDPGQNKGWVVAAGGPVADGNPIDIEAAGWYKVVSGHFVGGNSSVWNRGSFILEPGTIAEIKHKVPMFAGLFPDHSFRSTGVEYIAADATLKLTHMMLKHGGTISIKTGAKPAGFEGNIKGNAHISNGDVTFDTAGGPARSFGQFWVNGNLTWEAGTFHQRVDATANDVGDYWRVYNGTFTIGGPNTRPKIKPTALDAQGTAVNPPANREWFLFEVYDMNGIVTVNNGPQFDSNWPIPPSFIVDQQNPMRWAHVKSN